jgi:hypothetical protein
MRRPNELPGSKTEYYSLIYTSPDGITKTTYDLQEINPEDGKLASYIISESEYNFGLGFDDIPTRDAVAHAGARAAINLNSLEISPESKRELEPEEINLYQQMPDGTFDKVMYQKVELGQDGPSKVGVEMERHEPGLNSSINAEPAFTETERIHYSREQVQELVNSPIHAPEQSRDQAREFEILHYENMVVPYMETKDRDDRWDKPDYDPDIKAQQDALWAELMRKGPEQEQQEKASLTNEQEQRNDPGIKQTREL